MPIGDEKHHRIYRNLVGLLGEENVEDDPAVMEAFSRESQSPMRATRARCEFIVLPGNTQDVQAVYRLANQLDFPCSVTATGLLMTTCSAVEGHPHWCLIDPKRMTYLSIDAANMYAIVEPYVSVAQVQAEAMRADLFMGCTGAGAQGSALSTSLSANSHWTGWRTGKGRGLLGVEWVLPTGDVLRSGSLTNPAAGFGWGEGPGIDALGLLRGNRGPMGALGMVTRAAIKLHPWPGPRVWPASGVQPFKESRLPADLFRTFVISYPSLEMCVEAIRELGESEIGGVVMQVNPYELVALGTRSREEFWAKWQTEFWQRYVHGGHMILVILWGFAAAAQVDHEQLVLNDIVTEYGGHFLPDGELDFVRDLLTTASVRDSYRTRYLRLGVTTSLDGGSDSLYDTLRSVPQSWELLKKYSPPFGDGGLFDRGQHQHKFWVADFGRVATTGSGVFGEKSEECEALLEGEVRSEVGKRNAAEGIFSPGNASEASRSGPRFANIHLYLAAIKRALDPSNIANPTRMVDVAKVPLPRPVEVLQRPAVRGQHMLRALAGIVGREHVMDDPVILREYGRDSSLCAPGAPEAVVRPASTEQVQEVVRFAFSERIPITPRSSTASGFYGAAVPSRGGVVVDLRRMDGILDIDLKDRKVRIEPGVTWAQLQPELRKHGLMVCQPLLPHPQRSVLTSAMQREPLLVPKFEHNENFMTAEIVLGDGELFWMGTALAKGMVGRSNPEAFILGTRLFRGHQGSLGIVTWANIKAESIPAGDRAFFIPFRTLQDAVAPVYRIQRQMLGSECFILNNVNLASILAQKGLGPYDSFKKALPPLTVVLVLSGLRRRPEGRIAYEEEALRRLASDLGFTPASSLAGIPGLDTLVLDLLRRPWKGDPYWKLYPGGGSADVFFHAGLDRAPAFARIVTDVAERHGWDESDIGVYIQPVERARSCHQEFGFKYDPGDETSVDRTASLFRAVSRAAYDAGALFTNPYGPWADLALGQAPVYLSAMRAVKAAFDPMNIMNPGKLGF